MVTAAAATTLDLGLDLDLEVIRAGVRADLRDRGPDLPCRGPGTNAIKPFTHVIYKCS